MPSDSGSRGTEVTDFIQCINGQEPQVHELWFMVLDGIGHKVHSTARVEVTSGTVGEFVTDYFAENGRQIEIIGQLSVNESVHFFVFFQPSLRKLIAVNLQPDGSR